MKEYGRLWDANKRAIAKAAELVKAMQAASDAANRVKLLSDVKIMLPQGSSVIAYKIAAAELAALRAAAHGEAQVTAKKVRILVARIAAAEARFRQSPKIEIQAGHLRSKIGLYITGVKAA